MRALFQRKKGRDLYDFCHVMQQSEQLDPKNIIAIFEKYLEHENTTVSRAEFEKNLTLKLRSPVFNNDIRPLLSIVQANNYNIDDAYQLLFAKFLPKLKGEVSKANKNKKP